MIRRIKVEINKKNQASSKYKGKFYIFILSAKKECEDQDATHLIPDIQKVSTSILPKEIILF